MEECSGQDSSGTKVETEPCVESHLDDNEQDTHTPDSDQESTSSKEDDDDKEAQSQSSTSESDRSKSGDDTGNCL